LIRRSSGPALDALIKALGSESSVDREAAIARLTLSGARAVPRLVDVVAGGTTARVRVGALKVLEALADEAALEPVLAALVATDVDVAAAAVAAAVPLLGGPRGPQAVDRLTAVAVDSARDTRLRVAAIRALKTLKASTIAPLLKTLATDRDQAVRLAAAGSHADASVVLAAAAAGELPAAPADLLMAIDEVGQHASLNDLQRVIEHVREREAASPKGVRGDRLVEQRRAWARVRGRVHATLATRGSRVALYDLRESIQQAAEPLPMDFIAAVTRIGDGTALEPIAVAYERNTDDWWRQQLAAAFRAIATRENVTRRSAVVRKIEKRRPDVLLALFPKP